MSSDTFMGMVNNAALLLALAVLYDTLPLKRKERHQTLQIFTGVLIGLIGIAVMLTPWNFLEGVNFDTRSILLSLTGFFFGPLPTLVVAVMTIALRLVQGGVGDMTGVSVILTSAGLGLGWRYLVRLRGRKPQWYEFYGFGLVVHIVMLLCMLFLPWETAVAVLKNISLPVMTIYPIVTVLLGLLLARQRQRNLWEYALQEERDLLARISETSLDAILLTSPEGGIQSANPAACRMFGRSEQEIIQLGRTGIADSSDPRLALALEERARVGRFSGQLTMIRQGGEKFPAEIASAIFQDQEGRTRASMIIRDITERKHMEESIFLMSETQFQIAQLNAVEEILQLVGEKIQSLIKSGQTVLTVVDEDLQAMRVIGMYGFDEDSAQLIRDSGYNLEEIVYPLQAMTPEELQFFQSNRLQKFEGGFYNLLVRQVPEAVCIAFEASLQISAIYTISFVWENVDYGGLTILARRDLTAYREMIETIMTQASIAIRRIRSEQFLQESNEYRQNVFASLQDGFSVLDQNGVQREVNRAFCEMTGLSPEELIGVGPPHPYWPPEEFDNIQEALGQTLRNENVNLELLFMRKNGERFPVIVSPSAIKNKHGEIIRFAATVKDITERKQIEEKLDETRAMLQAAFDNNQAGMMIAEAPSGRLLYVNRAALLIRDKSFEEIVDNVTIAEYVSKWNILNLNGEPYKTDELPLVRAVLFGETVSQELIIRRDNLEDRLVWANAAPILGPDGKVKFGLVVFLDITEQRRVENLSRLRLELFEFSASHSLGEVLQKTLAEVGNMTNSPIGLYHFVESDQKTLSQQAWLPLALAECCRSDRQGKHSPIDQSEVLITCVQTKKPVIHNDYGTWPNRQGLSEGHAPLIRELVVPILRSGQVVAILGVGNKPTDYTEKDVEMVNHFADVGWEVAERKMAQDEIGKLNAELEQRVQERTAQLEVANKELEAFSYTVSHDLRAPLRHINGYIELLTSRFPDALPEKGQHYLANIVESANEMGVLIDDLLQFSRTNRQEMRHSKFDMNGLLREVMNGVKYGTNGRDIAWETAVLPHVSGDYNLLKLVWINLLSNAIKFTQKREKARIEVGFQDGSKEFIFFVRDNGTGFEMKYAQKLFGVFQRLHSDKEYEGTGIGLANVRRIVLRHGGRVWAEAELDKGATFYFTLPNGEETA